MPIHKTGMNTYEVIYKKNGSFCTDMQAVHTHDGAPIDIDVTDENATIEIALVCVADCQLHELQHVLATSDAVIRSTDFATQHHMKRRLSYEIQTSYPLYDFLCALAAHIHIHDGEDIGVTATEGGFTVELWDCQEEEFEIYISDLYMEGVIREYEHAGT